jgi:hypothetical protein
MLLWKPLTSEQLSSADLSAVNFNNTKSLTDLALAYKYARMNPDEKSGFQSSHPDVIDSIESDPEILRDLLIQALSSYTKLEDVLHFVKCNETFSVETFSRICDLILHTRLSEHENGLLELYDGLASILPVDAFTMFTANELDNLFCGQPKLDVTTLKKATIYEDVLPTDR